MSTPSGALTSLVWTSPIEVDCDQLVWTEPRLLSTPSGVLANQAAVDPLGRVDQLFRTASSL